MLLGIVKGMDTGIRLFKLLCFPLLCLSGNVECSTRAIIEESLTLCDSDCYYNWNNLHFYEDTIISSGTMTVLDVVKGLKIILKYTQNQFVFNKLVLNIERK